MTKDELQARVGKLERANSNLRAKNRELTRAARESDEQVASLEQELRRLERKSAPKPDSDAPKPRRRRRADAHADADRPERDPGDAVPPGVAVETPEPLGEEDERVKERLEELGSE